MKPAPEKVQPQAENSKKLALTGVVFSMLLAPVGLIISIIARKRAKRDGDKTSAAIALGGIIYSIIMAVSLLFGVGLGLLTARVMIADYEAGAQTINIYMQHIVAGECEEAQGYIDGSSPLVSQSVDCTDPETQTIANYVIMNTDNYSVSYKGDDLEYTYTTSGSEGYKVFVITRNGKIYQVSTSLDGFYGSAGQARAAGVPGA